MSNCKVSVIVPVHNSEEYLEECVTSICQQTLHDIEIILVENASTDDSLQLCYELARRDERIKVEHLDVGDLSTARNYGVDCASGDYVGFVDSDDVIAPDMYKSMYDLAISKQLDTVVCNYVRYRSPDDIRYQYCEDGTITIYSPKDIVALNLKERISQSACTMLILKSIVLNHRFPPFRYFEDRFSTFRFLAASKYTGHICISYYKYLQFRGAIRNLKSFKRNYDFAYSDASRLDFILNSGMFTEDEMPAVAAKSAESLLRKLNRMRVSRRTEEDKAQYAEMKTRIRLIPAQTPLSLKARLIYYFTSRSLATK